MYKIENIGRNLKLCWIPQYLIYFHYPVTAYKVRIILFMSVRTKTEQFIWKSNSLEEETLQVNVTHSHCTLTIWLLENSAYKDINNDCMTCYYQLLAMNNSFNISHSSANVKTALAEKLFELLLQKCRVVNILTSAMSKYF